MYICMFCSEACYYPLLYHLLTLTVTQTIARVDCISKNEEEGTALIRVRDVYPGFCRSFSKVSNTKVCVYVSTYMCMCVYMFTRVCLYFWRKRNIIYAWLYVLGVCVCVCACMYVCACVPVHVDMYAWVYVCMHVRTCACAYVWFVCFWYSSLCVHLIHHAYVHISEYKLQADGHVDKQPRTPSIFLSVYVSSPTTRGPV